MCLVRPGVGSSIYQVRRVSLPSHERPSCRLGRVIPPFLEISIDNSGRVRRVVFDVE